MCTRQLKGRESVIFYLTVYLPLYRLPISAVAWECAALSQHTKAAVARISLPLPRETNGGAFFALVLTHDKEGVLRVL